MARRLMLRLAPAPDAIYLLGAPPDVVHARKPELTIEEIAGEMARWKAALPGALVLDAMRTPGELADEMVGNRAPIFEDGFRRYPPGLGHVLIPTRPRSAGVHASSLYAATRFRAVAGHRVGRLLIAVAGTGWLPRASLEQEGVSEEQLAELLGTLRKHGVGIDALGIYTRTQAARNGFTFVTIGEDGPTSFVRVGEPSTIETECRSLTLLEKASPKSFQCPSVLDRGAFGSLEYSAQSVVLRGLHRPPRDPPIDAITAEIQSALAELPRPADVADHWVPIHGDFTPWNLRQRGTSLSLIDWELPRGVHRTPTRFCIEPPRARSGCELIPRRARRMRALLAGAICSNGESS